MDPPAFPLHFSTHVFHIFLWICVRYLSFYVWVSIFYSSVTPASPLWDTQSRALSRNQLFIYFEWTLTSTSSVSQIKFSSLYDNTFWTVEGWETHSWPSLRYFESESIFGDGSLECPMGSADSVLLTRNPDAVWSPQACSHKQKYLK